jgi:hypothetical protein
LPRLYYRDSPDAIGESAKNTIFCAPAAHRSPIPLVEDALLVLARVADLRDIGGVQDHAGPALALERLPRLHISPFGLWALLGVEMAAADYRLPSRGGDSDIAARGNRNVQGDGAFELSDRQGAVAAVLLGRVTAGPAAWRKVLGSPEIPAVVIDEVGGASPAPLFRAVRLQVPAVDSAVSPVDAIYGSSRGEWARLPPAWMSPIWSYYLLAQGEPPTELRARRQYRGRHPAMKAIRDAAGGRDHPPAT